MLDAAKAKGFRDGENPARWRGHLDHLLPKRLNVTRGHHRAMAYEEVPAFFMTLPHFRLIKSSPFNRRLKLPNWRNAQQRSCPCILGP